MTDNLCNRVSYNRYFVALRATNIILKASVSEILTEAFSISSNKIVTRSAASNRKLK
jgi:general stress protein CsbA